MKKAYGFLVYKNYDDANYSVISDVYLSFEAAEEQIPSLKEEWEEVEIIELNVISE